MNRKLNNFAVPLNLLGCTSTSAMWSAWQANSPLKKSPNSYTKRWHPSCTRWESSNVCVYIWLIAWVCVRVSVWHLVSGVCLCVCMCAYWLSEWGRVCVCVCVCNCCNCCYFHITHKLLIKMTLKENSHLIPIMTYYNIILSLFFLKGCQLLWTEFKKKLK